MAGVQLLVFDSRRGNREGEEIQKILAFHPADTPTVEQITTAGLLHGLLLFSFNFSQDYWEVAETDKSTWVAHQAEPKIWFGLAAPRTWVPRHCTECNLQAVLVQAHQIIRLLHGPIEGLLQQDASGQQAQRAIQPVLEYLGRQLASKLTWQHRQLRNPLADVALAPTLRLSPATSLAVQNFCNGVQLAALGRGGGSRGVEGVMLLYQLHVLWSSLAPGDSAAVYNLAATALLHPQSTGQRGTAGEASQPNLLDSCCWHQLPSKYVVLRPGCLGGCQTPRQRQEAEQEQEEVVNVLPVLIQSGQEQCHLLPYKEGKLWVLLLVSASVALTQHTLATLQAAMAAPAQQLAAQVAQEVHGMQAEAAHVPGYRYMYCDQGFEVATPRVKISAMQHHSRALAASLRESLARLEPPRSDSSDDSGGGGGGGDGDSEGEGQLEAGHVAWPEAAWLAGSWSPGAGGDSTGSAQGAGRAGAVQEPELWELQGGGSSSGGGGSGAEATGPAAAAAAAERDGMSATANEEATVEQAGEGLQQLSLHERQPRAASVRSSGSSGEGGAGREGAEEGGGMVREADHNLLDTAKGGREAGGEPQLPVSSSSEALAGLEHEVATPTWHALGGPPEVDPAEPVLPALPGGPVEGQAYGGGVGAGASTPAAAVGANDVCEVLVCSSQNCWAQARVGLGLGRQLLVIRERKTEKNLAGAVAVMDAFTDSFMC